MRAWLYILLVLLPLPVLSRPALAGPPPGPPPALPRVSPPLSPLTSPSQLCESAIINAERVGRLPARMMDAIAVVESGRPDDRTGKRRPWPWTINAEGQGFFFATKPQAIAAVQALQARGVHSIDVGCMQVNLMFHPDAFATLDAAFDPGANALYAARFLNALYTASHDWPTAIASYHSETPAIGAEYRERVMARWGGLPDLAAPLRRYADFQPPSSRYQDFQPSHQVYGAFANAFDAKPNPFLQR